MKETAQNISQNKTVRQFVKFAIVGASSTVLDWGVHALLYKGFSNSIAEPVRQWWLDTFPGIAAHPDFDGAFTTFKAVSFIIATVNGFIWNRAWTFRVKDRETRNKQFMKFSVVTGAGMVINLLVSSQIHTKNGGLWNYVFSLGLATFVTMFWNFAGHKLWTFKPDTAKADA